MSAAALAKATMRFGAWFGIAAVVLLAVGPFLNRNFGVADSLGTMPLSAVWEVAPVAVLVSLTYLLLLVSAALLSAILITTSLVIRRSESEDVRRDKASTPTVR